jgi:hypothetical protein
MRARFESPKRLFGDAVATPIDFALLRAKPLTFAARLRFHDFMQHEFTHAGANALLSSHICEVCGLVVSIAKSQPSSALPLDGCCIRSDFPRFAANDSTALVSESQRPARPTAVR